MAAFSGTSRPGGVFSARPPTTPSRRGRSRRGPLPPSPDTRCPCAEGSRGCPEMCRRWNAVRGTGMNRRASASGCGSAPLACRAFSSKIASYVVFFIAWTKLHTRSGRDPPFARVRVGRVSYSHGSLSCSLAGWGLSKLSVVRSVQKPRRPAGRRAVDKSPQTVASSRAINWSKKVENNHLIHVEVESHHLVCLLPVLGLVFFSGARPRAGGARASSIALPALESPASRDFIRDRSRTACGATHEGRTLHFH